MGKAVTRHAEGAISGGEVSAGVLVVTVTFPIAAVSVISSNVMAGLNSCSTTGGATQVAHLQSASFGTLEHNERDGDSRM